MLGSIGSPQGNESMANPSINVYVDDESRPLHSMGLVIEWVVLFGGGCANDTSEGKGGL